MAFTLATWARGEPGEAAPMICFIYTTHFGTWQLLWRHRLTRPLTRRNFCVNNLNLQSWDVIGCAHSQVSREYVNISLSFSLALCMYKQKPALHELSIDYATLTTFCGVATFPAMLPQHKAIIQWQVQVKCCVNFVPKSK